ncbi:MAG: hypothetical protein CG438_1737 [Methylococcaceae bacterium NSP1-1]|nr:MAG: hypothetical protein CG438_1737 [Methylococcaceae bacterium NSP1-1]
MVCVQFNRLYVVLHERSIELSNVGRATVLSLPDISIEMSGINSMPDHVGHKQHARPCMIKFKINIGQRDQVSFNSLLGGRPDLRTGC